MFARLKFFPAIRLYILAFAFHFAFASSYSQTALEYESTNFRLDDWRAHTSMLQAYNASLDSKGGLWVATAGGVFRYSLETGSAKYIRNIGELLTIETSVVKCDPDKKRVYVGAFDGTIDIVSEDFRYEHITDITNMPGIPDAKINDFAFDGDLIYIAGGFGFAVFDGEEKVFVENVSIFGDISTKAPMNKIKIVGDEIWLAGEAGLAKASKQSQLADPANWTSFGKDDGLRNDDLKYLEYYNEQIIAGGEEVVYAYDGEKFDTLFSGAISGIAVYGGELYWASDYFLYKRNGENWEVAISPETLDGTKINGLSNAAASGEEILTLHFEGAGVGIYDDAGGLERFVPNSALVNQFYSVDVSEDGSVWACPNGRDARGKGVMKLSAEGDWESFTKDRYPGLKSDVSIHSVTVDSRGKVYCSTWGGGLNTIEKTDTGYVCKVIDHTNSPFYGLGDGSFVVVGETVEDAQGDVWAATLGLSTQGPLLVRFSEDGSEQGFQNYFDYDDRHFRELAVDRSGTVWVGAIETGSGLYYYNERYNKYGQFKTNNSSILANWQTALAVDEEDRLWIGTPDGLCGIINPYSVLSGDRTIFISSIRALKNQVVNDILVDALNNKWVATNTGVWVLSPDADEILAYINKDNSPISTDAVLCLAANNKTGDVYFGTDFGLYQASSFSAEPSEQFDLFCYPQPFSPTSDGEMVIEGLARDAEIIISTIDGKHIRTLTASGNKTLWDGRDENGALVSTGVYLALASSSTSEAEAVAKIAVVRK